MNSTNSNNNSGRPTEVVTRDSSVMDLSENNSILLNPKDDSEDVSFSLYNPTVSQEQVLPSLPPLPPLPSLPPPPALVHLQPPPPEGKEEEEEEKKREKESEGLQAEFFGKLPPIAEEGTLESQGFEGKHMRMFTPPTRISVCASQGIGGSMEFQSISSKKFLSKYFHMPIVDAAKELGMCTTMLKKLCRRCGISRWPYRKVFKKNFTFLFCFYYFVEQKNFYFIILLFIYFITYFYIINYSSIVLIGCFIASEST